MSIRDARREAAIERMADHVLANGLAGSSLRPLARAAGTSDRMLLYYFADKDELLAVTLERVAVRLAGLLDAALPAGTRLAPDLLLGAIWSGMTSPAMQPFLRVWLELAAGSARGDEPHRAIAGQIAELFHGWIADRVDGPDDTRAATASFLFVALEGAMLIDALGRRDLADAGIADAISRSGR
jgi:AcrR family transcriptional regulator